MCFELPKDREKRIKAEAADRESRVRKYEQDMGVQLTYSPVATLERPMPDGNGVVTLPDDGGVVTHSEVKTVSLQAQAPKKVLRNKVVQVTKVLRNTKSRADYMKDYRKRPKVCPHCGKEISGRKQTKESHGKSE